MSFTSPPEPETYNQAVWDIVSRVPAGKVVTYGQIARMIAVPGSANLRTYEALGPRWVGAAMAKCPDDLPWQRVVNAQGRVSPRPGADSQQALLEEEGIVFGTSGRIDLRLYGWDGSDTF